MCSYIDIADSASPCWGGQVSAMGGKSQIVYIPFFGEKYVYTKNTFSICFDRLKIVNKS